ncbi:MAG: hypothetical protein D3916_09740, partial [Candidatus Electrothrix sp. MAN1_4]|nr:hypothetical protein [Candidatus Electrothrix sp. MAN1_4]
TIEVAVQENSENTPLEGAIFLFTGTLTQMSRNEAKQLLLYSAPEEPELFAPDAPEQLGC